tara:strand:- start:241 stop:1293 length:1053 start_codon:yes stop_codon:yes gene_type:complete
MKKISKVLITGLGSIGQRHVRNIRKTYGKSISIIAYRIRKKNTVINADMTVSDGISVEKKYDIISFYDLEEALAQKPDVVFITNPNSLHIPIAIEAAKRGCHLYIEKELSNNWKGVNELSKIIKSKNLVAFVAYQRRFHPGYEMIYKTIKSGKLGNILSVNINSGEYIKDWHPYEDFRKMHAAVRELGGGSLMHQTHELNLLLWYFGLPKKILALGGSVSKLRLDVEDSVDIMLEFLSDAKKVVAHVHIDLLQRPARRICEIIGDESYLYFDFFKNELIIQSNKNGQIDRYSYENFNRDDMFISAISEFFSCIEKNKVSDKLNLDEGIKSMKISMAAKESLLEEKMINLV